MPVISDRQIRALIVFLPLTDMKSRKHFYKSGDSDVYMLLHYVRMMFI